MFAIPKERTFFEVYQRLLLIKIYHIMKKVLLLICLVCGFTTVSAQEGGHVAPECTEWYSPQPPKVQPGDKPGNPPSDAIILFHGKNLDQWVSIEDG